VPITGSLAGPQSDPEDDKILECSAVGQATHIVTGDRQYVLPMRRFRDIEIVTPTELIRISQQSSPQKATDRRTSDTERRRPAPPDRTLALGVE